MAKGNIILGYLRGSIGDITFFRAKGQQLSRARNRAPANPRTVAQMDQRAKMACAVKFYTQVGTNFFKYAFEGKKDKESYFNAFVKNNILLGGYIGKQASRVYDFPALGAWQISSGTLPEITAPFPQSVRGVVFSVGTVSGTPLTTISDLSKALIVSDSSRWRDGDILTCLCYCATNYSTLPTISTDQGNRAYTAVWQIRLSTSNKDTLPALEFPLLEMSFECVLNSDGLSFIGSTGSEYTNNLYCFGLIHSRNTANGLRVSSSTMVAPQSPDLLSVVSLPSGSYYNAVIADWQATDEAVLQGGLSAVYAPSPPTPGEVVGAYAYNSQDKVWVDSALGGQSLGTKTGGTLTLRLKCVNGANISSLDFSSTGKQCTFVYRKTTDWDPPVDCYDLVVTYPAFTSGEEIKVYFGDILLVKIY